jgi:hypothetical protein
MVFEIRYDDGTEMRVGDRVLVTPQRRAVVSAIFCPDTKIANDYCSPGGGFMLEFEDEDVHVWSRTDEDIRLLNRGRNEGSDLEPGEKGDSRI